MARVGRRKAAPEGWEDIEPTVSEIDRRLRDVENDTHEGKRVSEAVWPIFKLHHQKSRYIYELYHVRAAISRELYEWCLEERVADRDLIAKWKKPGYERLCCVQCVQARDTNFGTACICRVPKDKLEAGRVVECKNCGCRGCSG